MAYGGGLENRFRFQANVGSNPTPSARSNKVLTFLTPFPLGLFLGVISWSPPQWAHNLFQLY